MKHGVRRALVVFGLLFAGSVSATEEELLGTLRNIPGVTNVRKDASTLWIGVTLSALGTPPKERAQEIADYVSKTYKGHVGKGICVRVYYGNENQLARSCSY